MLDVKCPNCEVLIGTCKDNLLNIDEKVTVGCPTLFICNGCGIIILFNGKDATQINTEEEVT